MVENVFYDEEGKPIKIYDDEGNEITQETDVQVIKLDMSELRDTLKNVFDEQTKQLTQLLTKKEKLEDGKGFTGFKETEDYVQLEKVAESFKGIREDSWKMTEQWTVVIPNYTLYEPYAHLRDYVWVQTLLKGNEGDVANIPYVKDVDFEILAAVGDAFAAPWTSLVSSVTTTLYEAGGYYDLPYYLLERINQNLLSELNKILVRAAIRAEDEEMMTLVNAGTSTNFAGNVTRLTGAAYFYASNIPKALNLLMVAGKKARTSECLLYLTSYAYGALLEELAASSVIAQAQPSIIVQGEIEKYLGVKIVVGGYRPSAIRQGAGTGTVDLAFFMRPKRAIALAPKRDILIETDKQIATRALRITASHTFGVKILDFKEIVRIWTSRVG